MKKIQLATAFILSVLSLFACIYIYLKLEKLELLPEDSLTLHTLNVVDRHTGKPVIIISDSLPNPILEGVELPRIFETSGMLYYDMDGNELGGLVQPKDSKVKQSMFTMDYSNTDAFSIFKQETDSTFRMGLVMFDKNTKEEFEVRGSGGVPRAIMANDNKDAVFLLRDTNGLDRVLLMVDRNNEVVLQVFDENGAVVRDLMKD